jgi:hypothetical protein
VIAFSDYTIVWCDQLVTNRIRNYESQVDTWDEMKSFMRRKLMPSHFYIELYQRFQSLSQGTKSVNKYFNEMELVIIRSNIKEDREDIMARFMNGLNHDISNIMELYHYVKLEEMVHMAMKVEKQLKRKGTIRQS